MMTVEDLMRAAWEALLRGDTAERDRLCGLATNLMNASERLEKGYPPEEAISIGAPIRLPNPKEKMDD